MKANSKVTSEELANVMESLCKFTLPELIHVLNHRFDRVVNHESMRCRLSRMLKQVDPKTGGKFLDKSRHGRRLVYICTSEQAERIREKEHLKRINASIRRRKEASKRDSRTEWGTKLSGKPGTTVSMRARF